MDAQTYLRESERTAAGDYHADLVGPAEMDFMFQAVITAGAWADRVKRALFYGEATKTDRIWSTTSLDHDVGLKDLVHAVLGCITESAEMAEHLRDVMSGAKPLDRVNILEEIGDVLWYQAMALRFLNNGFDAAFTANIDKLRARFPDKFTEAAALNRDLGAERAVLEAAAPVTPLEDLVNRLRLGDEPDVGPEPTGIFDKVDTSGRVETSGYVRVADTAADNIKLQDQYSIAIAVLGRIMTEATTVQHARQWASEVLKPRPAKGSKWTHRNGTAYTVLHLANAPDDDDRYPLTVVYQGPNGAVWARRADDWHRSMTRVQDTAQGTAALFTGDITAPAEWDPQS